ncbi:PHP domain-containing protein [Paludibaculum fermentans]|uniref:PHP domain-containing protein n=1 Tax=Paludibaculum fermentans TaxID=1473598 RepID=UPI003EBE7E48
MRGAAGKIGRTEGGTLNRTRMDLQWREPRTAARYRRGVSLHSHTMHSRETLSFIPRHVPHIPVLGALVGAQERRYRERTGNDLDYTRAWWTPPLSGPQALELEGRQITETLGLEALVSLTDHDNMEAPRLLTVVEPARLVPHSVEWTVPFGPSFVHLGIHNIPRGPLPALEAGMREYSASPDADLLAGLLEELHGSGETLVVLNHPLWDEACIGGARHAALIAGFLHRHRGWIHALEFNGLRPWSENRAVLELGQDCGLPVVSGGDRHGLEPNAVVNLTNAATFCEFVDEVRTQGSSHMLVLPQFREPFLLRCFEVMRDALCHLPDAAGRESWAERVWYQPERGEPVTLAELWCGEGPAVVRHFVGLVQLFSNSRVHEMVRAALSGSEEAAL